MIRTLTTIFILCLFITGCVPMQSTDIVVTNKTVNMDEAQITVKPQSGNPADGPDNTPTCSPVENNITWAENRAPNPYLKGEAYAPVESYYPEKPSKHFTPFVSNYTSY